MTEGQEYTRESKLFERITDQAWGRRLLRARKKKPGPYQRTMLKFPLPFRALEPLLRKKRGARRR